MLSPTTRPAPTYAVLPLGVGGGGFSRAASPPPTAPGPSIRGLYQRSLRCADAHMRGWVDGSAVGRREEGFGGMQGKGGRTDACTWKRSRMPRELLWDRRSSGYSR
eukprot:3405333-Rhodomonas_salina.3